MIRDIFKNNFKESEGVYILDESDKYVSNFGKQWKKYRDVQIDSINKFNHSRNMLMDLLFGDLDILKDKKVLEIGCGAGRFTEIILSKSKLCVSVDLSSAIFHNIAKGNKNLILVKANFNELISNFNFDIIICRGVIQHTPNPLSSISKLHEFGDNQTKVIYDVYKMPKIGMLHPKYFFWRPLIKFIFTYENFEIFITKKIKILLKIKRKIKKVFFNSNFFSDLFIPIWDYKDQIDLSDQQLELWSILDTMDGIYAKYDKPQKHQKILNFLKKNNIKIVKTNKDKNYFISKKISL